MAKDDYMKAFKMGKKDYQSRMLRGVKPTLQVLDDFMPEKGSYHEAPLGLVQVPIAQILGTKTVGHEIPRKGIASSHRFCPHYLVYGNLHQPKGIFRIRSLFRHNIV